MNMTNENCLKGIRCPQCGNQDRFLIVARIMVDVTDAGADIANGPGMEWDEDSLTICPECDRDGPLREFRGGLPPDPEGMNDRRAGWAEQVLATFIDATGTDRSDVLPDLLADLMHGSDRNDTDFDLALERARWHYDAETARVVP
jgi:hypothetical protein